MGSFLFDRFLSAKIKAYFRFLHFVSVHLHKGSLSCDTMTYSPYVYFFNILLVPINSVLHLQPVHTFYIHLELDVAL